MSRRGGDGDSFIGTGLLFSWLLAVVQFESQFDVDRAGVACSLNGRRHWVVVGVRLVVGSGGMTTRGLPVVGLRGPGTRGAWGHDGV
jgi:hypothetical protein